uniref:ARAD1D04114p n=1 Tax=Blastobotrys adeninivorans TaxID=409370 RepID=A0A060T848_BLAAD
MGKFNHLPLAFKRKVKVPYVGLPLLNTPFYNKGSAFSAEERQTLALRGLVPPSYQTLKDQEKRAYEQYREMPTPLLRNAFMTSMSEQNTVLYYKLIEEHIKEMSSVIYTPTQGDAIQRYSKIFRRPSGCFLPITRPEEIEERLGRFVRPNSPEDGGIDYIVVTDGEAILGIGDQGVGGILICSAKLALTTACAGIHPDRVLPVVLDVGTDNQELRVDDLYLGLQQRRTRGKEYDEFVDKFVQTVRKLFPRAFLHFEDFGVYNARRLLDKYRNQFAVFNDDIQGTGCVTQSCVMAAAKVSGLRLGDLRVLVYGSGSAGTGIADQIAKGIAADKGISRKEAHSQIFCMDRQGLLLDNMGDDLSPAQLPFAKPAAQWEGKDTKCLKTMIHEIKPHVLLGTSTRPGSFTKEIVQEMARHVERPIIFPLSNPTRLHEAIPQDLYNWTDGKALVATGSPFDPVEYDGKVLEAAECNNVVCFPGIGLGCVLGRVKLLTDEMLDEAVRALAREAPALKDETKSLCIDVTEVKPVSVKIAAAIIKEAQRSDLLGVEGVPEDEAELMEWIEAQMWRPEYRELVA